MTVVSQRAIRSESTAKVMMGGGTNNNWTTRAEYARGRNHRLRLMVDRLAHSQHFSIKHDLT